MQGHISLKCWGRKYPAALERNGRLLQGLVMTESDTISLGHRTYEHLSSHLWAGLWR